MKLTKILTLVVLSLMFSSAYAVETEQESKEAIKNDVQRETDNG